MLILKVLTQSLIDTASAGYHYTIYLSYNVGDPLLDSDSGFQRLLEVAGAMLEGSRLRGSRDVRIDFARAPSSAAVDATHGLSILFNAPTLQAYADGCDYFYLTNDDLQLVTPGWTDALVGALRDNPVLPNLGVSGGVDLSGAQPFVEFPFFHRTHVEIFASYGANPWVFHNWFEDNWVNDVYIPFDSMFLLKDVQLRNYEGLGGPQVGGRYFVKYHDVPCWYFKDVAQARTAVRTHLLGRLDAAAAKSPKVAAARTALEALDLRYCGGSREGTVTLLARSAPHEVPSAPC
jgi:hypothetical protein